MKPEPSLAASPVAWAFRFDRSGRARPIVATEPIRLDCPDGGFVWCHLDLIDTRAMQWIAATDLLPEAAKALLATAKEHPQLDCRNGLVWGTIADFTREFDGPGQEVAHLRFAVGETFMITGRRRHLQAVDALRQAILGGATLAAPLDLFEEVMERVVDAYAALAQQISDALNEIEDRVLDDAVHDERRRLGPLRRKAAQLHRQLTGLRTIFNRLDTSPPRSLSAELRVLASRLLQRIDSLHQEVHSFQERARLLHEESAAKLAAETNRNLYILTVLATALMPPTFITGMFGMNVKGLPFADSDKGFLLAMLICAFSALAVFLPQQWRRGRR